MFSTKKRKYATFIELLLRSNFHISNAMYFTVIANKKDKFKKQVLLLTYIKTNIEIIEIYIYQNIFYSTVIAINIETHN